MHILDPKPNQPIHKSSSRIPDFKNDFITEDSTTKKALEMLQKYGRPQWFWLRMKYMPTPTETSKANLLKRTEFSIWTNKFDSIGANISPKTDKILKPIGKVELRPFL